MLPNVLSMKVSLMHSVNSAALRALSEKGSFQRQNLFERELSGCCFLLLQSIIIMLLVEYGG